MRSSIEANAIGAFVAIQSIYFIFIVFRIPYTLALNGKAGAIEAVLLFFALPVAQFVFLSILAAIDALGKWIKNLRLRSLQRKIAYFQTEAKPLRDRIKTLSDTKYSVLQKLIELR